MAAQAQAPVVHEGGKVRATPKARKVARELREGGYMRIVSLAPEVL